MSNELKPCPFCGGEPNHIRTKSAYHVFCSECASDVMVSTSEAMTTCQVNKLKLKAFDKWNTRAELELVKQLESELQAKTDFLALVIEEKQKLIDEKAELIKAAVNLMHAESNNTGREPSLSCYHRSVDEMLDLLERMK